MHKQCFVGLVSLNSRLGSVSLNGRSHIHVASPSGTGGLCVGKNHSDRARGGAVIVPTAVTSVSGVPFEEGSEIIPPPPPDHARRPRTKIIIYFPGNAFFFVVGRIGEWLTFSWPKLIFQEVPILPLSRTPP